MNSAHNAWKDAGDLVMLTEQPGGELLLEAHALNSSQCSSQ